MERRWAERSLYDNNYDLLRMVAALMVVFYHSYAAIGEFSDEPFMGYFWEWGKPGLSANNLGVIGVHIFFVISGYLVTASYMREHENYLERRLRRIMPGLIGGILFCAFIIGPLATVLPLAEYFQLRDLYWFLAYVFLFPVETIFTIGDVFATHHVPALNEPLWTIPWEMICYMQ
ncbi:MAG: acyltransferase family protein [Alphaproteobacteria bacterium]